MPENIKPFCFILMPFGVKKDDKGQDIDFDEVYKKLIKPAIKDADLEPIRADEEIIGGSIHKAMYERLILCDYAIADLTLSSANVFYELGVRHGARPHTTISIFKNQTYLPFDISFLRAIPYEMDDDDKIDLAKKTITKLLNNARDPHTDSPLFQTFDELKPTKISHLKTDVFRKQVKYSQNIKDDLEIARGNKKVREVHDQLASIPDVENGVIVDLFLSYRAIGDCEAMVKLVDEMVEPMKSTKMIQEQLGFALNRLGKRDQAEKVLMKIINKFGNDSETNGILGRVYKDSWQDTLKAGKNLLANSYLDRAIECYVAGFNADIRDAYPGINALTLLDCANRQDVKNELLPVVKYAVCQKLKDKNPDYWDYATLLEISVIEGNKEDASKYLGQALMLKREEWEGETTANNLKLFRENRKARGESIDWVKELEQELI